jgi:hypothetical protein
MPNAEQAAAMRASGRHGSVRVTPADVGARVVLRSVVEGGVTDVVGTLEAFADGVLTVRRRTGEVVTVDEPLLVSAKTLP